MATSPMPRLSASEYLDLERAAELKSEYLQGKIVAKSGAQLNHSWLSAAVIEQLGSQLRGKTCGAAGSDTRIHIAAHNVFTYPDVVVICGKPQFADARRDTIIDATMIVEIL